ncbi:alpha/beta fold hydrolase BchO [Sphingomonas sp. SUN039]|uniref:alpha/beta fold hydrolase BchO n=1 Tax=Sphingomonas sp. SUN039 TaxID=2937787 RepID=UPI002164739C|nr:alpha/beta fold hydrolase BchO [Sphingomonas sp. SUN039]UVO54138.1 alpha/beta fold hydrolase [Sphingomonas sp. SUN039]
MSLPPADWPNATDSRSVRVGGIDWHAQIAGDGPVLLLLHGTGAATHSWRDMLHPLAQHFRVIAPDLPGHGFTKGRPPNGLTMPGVARALAGLLGELDAEPALVVGHSAGAAIAIRMALDGLVRPAGIVGIAPALLPFPGIAQHLFPTMAKLLFVNPFAPHIFASVARGPGAVERFLARSTASKIDAAGNAAYAKLFATSAHCAGAIGMMADWDLVPLKRDLPKLAVPMLVLHGEKDAAIPVSGALDSVALIPDCALEVLPGLGHLAHEEAPHLAVDRILHFARTQAILATEGAVA